MTFTCATLIRDACRNDNPKVTAMRTAPSSFTRFPVLYYWLRRRSFVVWVNWKTACWKIQNYGLKATKLIDVTQSIAQSVFSLTVTYSSHRNFTRRQQVKCNEQIKTLAILLRSQDTITAILDHNVCYALLARAYLFGCKWFANRHKRRCGNFSDNQKF